MNNRLKNLSNVSVLDPAPLIKINTESQKDLTLRVLEILNSSSTTSDLIHEVLLAIKKYSGIESVSVRIRNGEGYSYYDLSKNQNGFVNQSENSIFFSESNNKLLVNEFKSTSCCLCENILKGTTNPELPFFTKNGSFWTNGMTMLQATTSKNELDIIFREQLNNEGYESTALIPLKVDNEIIGLLQLNDRREDLFTNEYIEFLEKLSNCMGVAIGRKQSECMMRESEEKFSKAFHDHQAPMAILNIVTGERIDVNNRLIELWGLNKEEYLQMNGLVDNTLVDAKVQKEGFSKLLKDRIVKDFPATITTNFGERKKILASGSMLDIDDGNIAVLSFEDITERDKAEDALRESEEKFRALVEISSDWIWEINNEAKFTYVSPQIENILGYKSEELLGKSPFYLMSEEEKERVGKIFKNLATKGNPIISLENISLHKDGSQIFLETNGVQVLDEDGNVKGYIGIDRDITKRKQAAEALQHSNKKLQEAQIIAKLGQYNYNISTEYWTCSKILDDIIGTDDSYKKDLNGWLQLIHPKHREMMADYLQNDVILQHKEIDKKYMLVNNKNGQEIWVHELAQLIYDDNGNLIELSGTLQDITESKNIENSLKDSNTALREILKTIEEEKKEQLLHVQSHVNRTILPLVRKLEIGANEIQSNYISLITDNLESVASPFISNLETRFVSLSPREVEICKMLKDGMTSQEIAETLHTSVSTVFSQRKTIRKKLKITNNSINLVSFLNSI